MVVSQMTSDSIILSYDDNIAVWFDVWGFAKDELEAPVWVAGEAWLDGKEHLVVRECAWNNCSNSSKIPEEMCVWRDEDHFQIFDFRKCVLEEFVGQG